MNTNCFAGQERVLTIGNYARKKLQACIIIGSRRSLPTWITLTLKESAILRRLASSFSTFHFFADIIWTQAKQNSMSKQFRNSKLKFI